MLNIVDELKRLNKIYPKKWGSRFVRNLRNSFSEETSPGIDLIVSQRLETVFPDMDNEQFKHYVLGVFQEFIKKLPSALE